MDKLDFIKETLVEIELRTDMEIKNKEAICKRLSDLSKELLLTQVPFKKAISNGSSGKYGIDYKLNFQVIGSWLHKYKKES